MPFPNSTVKAPNVFFGPGESGSNNPVIISNNVVENVSPSTPCTCDPTLQEDVPVIDTDVGAVGDGYIFIKGLTFTEFVTIISQKAQPPALTLSSIPSPTNSEIGTIISPVLNESFTQGGAGPENATRLYKNSVQISTTFPYTDSNIQLIATPIVYGSQVDYDEGPAYGSGTIPAGTISSNQISFVGTRLCFYGTPVADVTTPADVRSLPGTSFNSTNNSGVDASGTPIVASPTPNFTITIPIGATRVIFAYPSTLRDVASVLYQELSNSEVKGNFVQSLVTNVPGTNNYSPVTYKVYTYIPVEPFSIVNHYKVFI